MKRIAIAGGIGAGKSTVTRYLARLGWPVIDADVTARQITQPGEPAWQALRDAFGDGVLSTDGTLDRDLLAEIVFHDLSALRRLNHITHGRIGAVIVHELDETKGAAVFVALPLFLSEHRPLFGLDEVWAVQVQPETAVARLCEMRGFGEIDARARLANQMTNDERAAIVDRVIWNDGSLESLYTQLDALLGERGLSRG